MVSVVLAATDEGVADPRPLIDVACGVLIDDQGQVLIAQRPIGKIAAGKWEFPGGKIEPGETAVAALSRELHEELGIQVERSRPLLRFRHDYSDRRVSLDVHIVDAFSGMPESREQQALRWMAATELHALDLLPTVAPIVRALQLPADYVFTPQTSGLAELCEGLQHLPSGALLRLRLPTLDDENYAKAAMAVLSIAVRQGVRVLLDRDAAAVVSSEAAGWHVSQARAAGMTDRPIGSDRWFVISAHDEASLLQARRLRADAVVIGPVCRTPTHPQVEPLGWQAFGVLANQAGMPVYAIGGVGPSDLQQVQSQGGWGVAGISAYWRR